MHYLLGDRRDAYEDWKTAEGLGYNFSGVEENFYEALQSEFND